ncbi:MFS general substrate transporter [Lactarius indigo]|nr:MFS general substrate transporter [Lactarius indigo]
MVLSSTVSGAPLALEEDSKVLPDVNEPRSTCSSENGYEVRLEPEDDPQRLSLLRRWLAVMTISFGALYSGCTSSSPAFTINAVSQDFRVGKEVATLAISMFLLGLGIGPLLAGPLSEVYGRRIIYRVSFLISFVSTFPVAFAPHIAVYLIFRFVMGFCAAAFFSVAGGSISDMFPNAQVGTPMAVYSVSPFIGSQLSPIYSGRANFTFPRLSIIYNASWRWTYYVLIIWSFVEVVAIIYFVPETYIPVILKQKAQRLRKTSGDARYYAPIERENFRLGQSIVSSCYRPFQLLFFDPMALLIDLWTSFTMGLMYLTFEAFPIIFMDVHHFSIQMTGLTFIGTGAGVFIGLATTPFWNRLFAKKHGDPPPEFRLLIGQAGAVLVSASLFSIAFTAYFRIHWIAPIIASVPFGTGAYFVFTSSVSYLVVAYRPVAASAMAGNTAMRSTFGAAFPLFTDQIYHRMGIGGATVLLGGIAALIAPLPFIFYRVGARLRQKSKFAV